MYYVIFTFLFSPLFIVNLCTDASNKLQIYLEYFEKSYLEATKEFYTSSSSQYLSENGVQNYMRYVRESNLSLSSLFSLSLSLFLSLQASDKIAEEQRRATRYLETSKDSQSVKLVNKRTINSHYININHCR